MAFGLVARVLTARLDTRLRGYDDGFNHFLVKNYLLNCRFI